MTSDASKPSSSPARSLSWPAFIGLSVALLLAGICVGLTGFSLPAYPAQSAADPTMPSAFAQVVRRLGAVVYLLLDSSLVLLVIWAGAAGLGWPIRLLIEGRLGEMIRPASNESEFQNDEAANHRLGFVLQLGLGLGLLFFANYLAAVVGLISTVTAWAIPCVGVALFVWQVKNACPGGQVPVDRFRPAAWTALLAAPFVGILIVGACCPPGTAWITEAGGYDVMSYHLQLPREWLAQGKLTGVHHNVYSYLPSLVECQYTMIAAMRGGVYQSIFTCQLFHVSSALLAAAATAQLAGRWLSRAAAAFAGVLFIGVPWVLILSASAYNEMATLALAAVAFALLFHPLGAKPHAAIAAGALLGLATLAKLTAGPNLVIPAILIVLLRLNVASALLKTVSLKRAAVSAAILAIAGGVVLLPWFARNAIDTGNPVFPFATSVFGTGHWTDAQAAAWNEAHQPRAFDALGSGVELVRHWFLNTGYGAVGGQSTVRATENIAQFKYQFGIPTFWLLAGAGAIYLLIRGVKPPAHTQDDGAAFTSRKAAAAMLLILGVQIAFWIFMTHQQSRFLIFSLIPGAVLAACAISGFALIDRKIGREKASQKALLFPIAAVAVCALMVWLTGRLFDRQTPGAQPWLLVDTLLQPSQFEDVQPGQGIPGDHVLNHLPRGSHVYIVADVSKLLYIRTPMTYNSAFDSDALGDLYREVGPNPPDVLAALQDRDVDFLWVGWSELERLHNTYGYDQDVTAERIGELIEVGLVPMTDSPRSPLYAVPKGPPGASPSRLRP